MEFIDQILEFFSIHGEKILSILGYIVLFVVAIRRGKINLDLEEVMKMVYRSEHYVADQSREDAKGQSFNALKPVYRLNKATNVLELTDDFVDVEEIARSCYQTCLDMILERFLPGQNSVLSDQVAEREQLMSDIDLMQESFMLADEYRERYGLSADLTTAQVFERMQQMSKVLSDEIAAKESAIKSAKDIVKDQEGGKTDA